MLLELLEELLENVFEYTDIKSLHKLAVCSQTYSLLCRPHLWKKLEIPLVDIYEITSYGTKDLYINDYELEHLVNTVGGYFEHTESLRLTCDVYRLAHFEKTETKTLLEIISKILAKCSNLSVLHTPLTVLW